MFARNKMLAGAAGLAAIVATAGPAAAQYYPARPAAAAAGLRLWPAGDACLWRLSVR